MRVVAVGWGEGLDAFLLCGFHVANRFLKRERERECLLKAQVPDVSMRPQLCADADDLLRCSATVGNLGE